MVPYYDWYRYFAVIPFFAAFMWFSTLLTMLLTWVLTGRPKYVPQQVAVAYISDVGSSFLKPLFVIACGVTGVSLVISLMLERLVRHKGRLLPEYHMRERICSRLAIMGGMIAMCSLGFMSGFDAGRYEYAHMGLFLIFLFGVTMSAVSTVVEYRWLAPDYPEVRKLRKMYVAKTVVASTLVLLAVVFGLTAYQAPNVGGVLEWVMGFEFTSYLLVFGYELGKARDVRAGEGGKEGMVEIP